MRLLFVHDHPFYTDDNIVYSGGGLPSNIWRKYLINFTNILIFGRKSFDNKDRKVISSRENVFFHLTSNYSSVKQFLFNYTILEKEISSLVKESDVILVRLPSVLGLVAAKVALSQNKKLWVEQVGNGREAFRYHGSLSGKVIALPFDIINQRIVKKANFVSYVTETKLQKDYPSSENSITASLSDVIINDILKKEELDISRFTSNQIKIGLIGGFDTQYKGQDLLLKAVDLLDVEMKNKIELYFVGKGDFSKLLEFAKQLELDANLKFIGSLQAGEEINSFLKNLSLYVQPSLTEGMPRATIEAMSMGCPVIGSSVGGIPDVVNSKFIHDRGDYKQLAIHLKRLFNDRNLLIDEAYASLEKAEPYRIEKLQEKRVNFYSEMNKKLEFD